jgi:hypothetical protein
MEITVDEMCWVSTNRCCEIIIKTAEVSNYRTCFTCARPLQVSRKLAQLLYISIINGKICNNTIERLDRERPLGCLGNLIPRSSGLTL